MGAMRPAVVARKLLRDQSGAALMEFGLVLPTFILMTMGLLDIGHIFYARSLLIGAVEEAARSSSLETADTSQADEQVRKMVSHIAPGATITSSRASYFDFADIGRPERWNDADGDGICSGGESYTDENASGAWDPDVGGSGNGGASDVVIYTVTMKFDRLFKIPLLPGDKEQTLVVQTVKKNQPFADQARYGSTAGTCE